MPCPGRSVWCCSLSTADWGHRSTGKPSLDHNIPLPTAGEERREPNGKQQVLVVPRLRGRSLGPCPIGCRVPGGGRKGWSRDALGERGAQLGTARHPCHGPFPSQLRPQAPARHDGQGGALAQPAPHCAHPNHSLSTPDRGLQSYKCGVFSPHAAIGTPLRDPRCQAGAIAPCQGEQLPSPLPPLMLCGWTEGCLGESFSTLFHIHNGLNIGEQSGTWRAKPSPWSEPMTSPPR